MILHLEQGLLRCKVRLVVLLGLDRARHVQVAPVLAQVSIAKELLVQSLRTHVLFDAVDDLDYVFDVLLELFAYLQAVH